MDNQELYKEIADVLQCSVDSIEEDSSIHNHPAWTSMTHVQLMLVLGENYGIEFTPDNISVCTSIKGILSLVN